MTESTLMHSWTLLSGSPDSYWDLFTKRHQMRASCMFSVAALLDTLALPRPTGSAHDVLFDALVRPYSGFFEHLGEMRTKNPQFHLTRKVKLLSDTPAGGLTILEVSRRSLVQARALERVIIRTWAPICNTRGLHEIGRTRPRRLRPRPRTRPVAHLRSESLRQSTPLDSLYASLEKEVARWHACRSRWLKRQQALRDLSSGFDRFYKQPLDSRLVAGLGPLGLTVNLALSMVADLRPIQSLATLNLDEGQVLSAWRLARQKPRPGIRARLLQRLREHIDSRGWPVPGRRMLSVPPEISLRNGFSWNISSS